MECYWTLCRSPHPFQCTAKCENKDCWIMFASIWESESHVSCLKAQKHPNKNVLSTHFTVRSASGWFRNQKPLGSLKTEGICYSFVKLCSLTPSVFWSVVALFISNKWFESLLLWNDCVPTFLLIVFDWAGNQTWNTWGLISASRLKPVAYFYHMEQVTQCCSIRAFGLIYYDIR